jgi:hypothetical protein
VAHGGCIARTRTLAKLFVEAVEPFGAVTVTDPAGEREVLAAGRRT